MYVNPEKEVYFDKYCKDCAHFKTPECEEPCHECLNNFTNTYSHMPVMFEKKEN